MNSLLICNSPTLKGEGGAEGAGVLSPARF